MSGAKVTTIKPKGAAPGYLPPNVIERLNEARDIVFQAHSIAAVAAAAAVSEMPANEHCTETTLRFVSELLDKVAAMIEPGSLDRAADNADISPELAALIDAVNANPRLRELFDECVTLNDDQIAALETMVAALKPANGGGGS